MPCGSSAYRRVIDLAKFWEIADGVHMLMPETSHTPGLVTTGLRPLHFEPCDIVTTTTCKSLRGPRAGVIFFRYTEKGPRRQGAH